MNVLIKVEDGDLSIQLPDDIELFKNQQIVVINDISYLFAYYEGSNLIQSDYNVDDYITSKQPDEVITVTIENVTGKIEGYFNKYNEFTVPQRSELVSANGKINFSDRLFKVPFKRVDTGRIQLMPAEIKSGEFKITLNFETNGVWIINQQLINSDFDNQLFEISEYTFSVL